MSNPQIQKGLSVTFSISATGLQQTGPWQAYNKLFNGVSPGIFVAQNNDLWIVSQTNPLQTWNNSHTSATNANGDAINIAHAGYPVPGRPVGCLVCCLGQLINGKYTPVQYIQGLGVGPNSVDLSQPPPIAPAANLQLLFTINDDLKGAFGPGLADNSGSLDITVMYNGQSAVPGLK